MSVFAPLSASPPADASAPENFDDLHLHSLATTGDSAAFAALFHRYYSSIHAFAYRLVLCPGIADDIAQATFIHAARSLASFRRDASFKNWLYAIATNLSRDLHRSRARRETREQQLALLAPDPASAHRDHAATDSAHAAVRDALARLAPEQREAVALVYYENLSHAEAARVLRCAESTVSWRLFRAKGRLKKILSLPGTTPGSSRHDR